MGLDDYTPERVEMAHKGQVLFSVRGLTLDDISQLVAVHLDDMRQVANLWRDAAEEIYATVLHDDFLTRLVTEVPSLAMTVLALASENPGKQPAIAKLPLGLQLKALAEVARMTLEDVGGPKAFAALIRGTMSKATQESSAAETTTGTTF